MKTDGSSNRLSLRRPETGAVLVVVLLAMIALLGMGLTGLYLTSGSIQMSANINMRNQALYVAEAGIQTAKSVLNRQIPGMPGFSPNLSRMLAGGDLMGNAIALPVNFVDEIPGNSNVDPMDPGCIGTTSTGTFTRGAYLRDSPGLGCRADTSAYIDCDYPPTYSPANSGTTITHNEAPPDPNTMSPAPTQFMGKYTLFIRQDLGECRLGLFTDEGPSRAPPLPAPNGIVVIRSEGVASDNRTKVVLEVTMSPNPNVQIGSTGIASVCPAGAAGCDDNSSVQQGITVAGSLTPPPPGAGGAPGAGGSGAGGASASGGSASGGAAGTSTTPLAGAAAGGSVSSGGQGQGGSATGGAGGSTSGCTKDSQCNGQTCCSNKCVDLTSDSGNCGACNSPCPNSKVPAPAMCCYSECVPDPGCPYVARIGQFGPWDSNNRTSTGQGSGKFQKWLAQHSAGCGGKNIPLVDSDGNANLITSTLLTDGKYQVIVLLDVNHSQQDLLNKINGVTEKPCESYRYRGKGMGASVDTCYDTYWAGSPQPAGLPMRAMQDSEARALASWVQGGGGLITIVGNENEQYEIAFPNAVLAYAAQGTGLTAIQYSTFYSNTKTLKQDDMMQFAGAPSPPGGPTYISGVWDESTGFYGFKTTGLAAALTNGIYDPIKKVGGLRASNGFQVTPAAFSSKDTNPFAFARAYGYDEDETVPPPPTNFGLQYATIGVAGKYSSGRVVVWGDEWITYDTVWGNQDNNRTYTPDVFWNNVIAWLYTCH